VDGEREREETQAQLVNPPNQWYGTDFIPPGVGKKFQVLTSPSPGQIEQFLLFGCSGMDIVLVTTPRQLRLLTGGEE